MKQITILLAEDHAFVRDAIRKVLELESDIDIVGEAQDGREAVALAGKLRPAVVLMDITMPVLNGLEATRRLLKVCPETRVIVLSAHADDMYVKNAIEFGAAGFLLKQASVHEVCRAIHEVQKGKNFFSPAISRHFDRLHSYLLDHAGPSNEDVTPLTSREIEVLQLIAEGKTNKAAAMELGISIKTVEKHRDRLMHKLDIHDPAGLTRYAISTGLIRNWNRGTSPSRNLFANAVWAATCSLALANTPVA